MEACSISTAAVDIYVFHKSVRWYVLDADCHELYSEFNGQLIIRYHNDYYVYSDGTPVVFGPSSKIEKDLLVASEACSSSEQQLQDSSEQQQDDRASQPGVARADPLRAWMQRGGFGRGGNEHIFFEKEAKLAEEKGEQVCLVWDEAEDDSCWLVDGTFKVLHTADPPPRYPWMDGVPQ